MYEIDYYRDDKGRAQIEEFINGLNVKMRAKVFGRIELLEQFGPALRMPYSEALEDGIFELRIPQSNNITHILYFFFDGKRIVLTNGFVKKTQKTPRKEIEFAKNAKSDWIRRHG